MTNSLQNKTLLFEAIDNYALFPKTGRLLLKVLINLAVDNTVITNITELSKLSKISRPSVYANLKRLEANGVIECQKNEGSRISSFLLKPKKFNDILIHHQVRKDILQS
jgi:DNA-binding MarR family transcriptional regulator|tara:strand:- start:470 stop:796 length:327 start_codon:yes stop_codon:yes gene_type:complete